MQVDIKTSRVSNLPGLVTEKFLIVPGVLIAELEKCFTATGPSWLDMA